MLWWTLRQLRSSRFKTRQRAADHLAKLKDPRAIKALVKLLTHSRSDVSSIAAKTLGTMGDRSAVDPLIATLKARKQDPFEVRSAAAKALGELGDSRAVDALIEVLNQDTEYVRCVAAEALGRIRDLHALDPLITALSSEKPPLRRAAALALGEIADPHSTEPLIAVFSKDSGSDVRCAAAQALGKIGDQRAVESLICALGDYNVKREATIALGQIGDCRAVEALHAKLRDFEIGKDVVEALERLQWQPSDEEQIYALVLKHDRAKLKQAGKDGVKTLIRLLGSYGYEKYRILEGLSMVDDTEAKEELVRVMKSRGEYCKVAADFLNRKEDHSRHHLLCPNCKTYLGTRNELMKRSSPIPQGSKAIASGYVRCPNCGARPLL